MNIRLCEYTVVWVYTDKLLYGSKTECCMTFGWLIVCIHEQQKYAYLKGISTKKSKGLGFFLRLTKVPTVREEIFLLLIWSSYSMKGIWPKTFVTQFKTIRKLLIFCSNSMCSSFSRQLNRLSITKTATWSIFYTEFDHAADERKGFRLRLIFFM